MFNKLLRVVSLFIPGSSRSEPPEQKILKFTEYENRFRYFLLIDKSWREGVFSTPDFFTKAGHQKITDLKHFIVTYRDGQIAYESAEFENYPKEISWMTEGRTNDECFTKEELTSGNHLFQINFSKSVIMSDDPAYYETKITNLSTERAKVIKFAGFKKTAVNCYEINNSTGDFFNAIDFNNWYMDKPDFWIHPGDTVSDPINYGGERNNWAYQVKTESGETFWFGNIR
ncbi:MAG: hypothetical protein K0R65_1731 [Crocinitomicaceae bacterium]|jgi:hypothetical protein|nr:hypothetical protein [Crocinitomicaceae bacterium]